MVISKCVPLAISRKKFSDFENFMSPKDVYFVGYKFEEDGVTKKNIRLKWDYILSAIKDDPEWGQGGGGNVPEDKPTNPEISGDNTEHVEAEFAPVEAIYYPTTVSSIDNEGLAYDEWIVDNNGVERPKRISEDLVDDEGQPIDSTIVDLKKTKGFIEINGGGTYKSEIIYIVNPQVGSITNVVVDNTGRNRKKDETIEEWEQNRVPVEDFVLFYGIGDNSYEILNVPAWHRGVVQILHTNGNDLIINQSYTDASHEYIGDVMPVADEDDEVVEGEIIDRVDNKIYVDMKNEAGFIEIDVNGASNANKTEFTFVFDNTEIGSMSYIVVDNQTNAKGKEVFVNYGKTYSKEGDERTEIIENGICNVENGEKAIIQVFHSLSMDIVVSVTKL